MRAAATFVSPDHPTTRPPPSREVTSPLLALLSAVLIRLIRKTGSREGSPPRRRECAPHDELAGEGERRGQNGQCVHCSTRMIDKSPLIQGLRWGRTIWIKVPLQQQQRQGVREEERHGHLRARLVSLDETCILSAHLSSYCQDERHRKSWRDDDFARGGEDPQEAQDDRGREGESRAASIR